MHLSTTLAAVTLLGLASAAQISSDGSCGGRKGYTCVGSAFGDCCSLLGRCGSKTAQCSPILSCQDEFGICDRDISTDGECGGSPLFGKTCRGSTFGSCCSKDGRCGNTSAECGPTCQSKYGVCTISSSSTSSSSTRTSTSTSSSSTTYPPSSFTTLVSSFTPTTSAAAASAYSSSLISSLSASFSSSISSSVSASVSSSVSASVSSSVSSSLLSTSTTAPADYTTTSQVSEVPSSTALEPSSTSSEISEAIPTTEPSSSAGSITSITVDVPASSTSSEAVPTCTPAYFSPPSDWPCFTLTGQADGVSHIHNKRLGSSYPSSSPSFSREDFGYEPSIYTLNPATGHVIIVSVENNRWMMGNMQAPADWVSFLPMYEDTYPESQFPKPFCTLTNERELKCCLTTECQFYGAALLEDDSRRYGLRFGSVYQYETPVSLRYDIVTCPVYDCVPIVDKGPGGEFKNYRPERKEEINPVFYKRGLEHYDSSGMSLVE